MSSDYRPPSSKATHNGDALLARVNATLENFLAIGQRAIQTCPIQSGKTLEQLIVALNNVRAAGKQYIGLFNKPLDF